MTKPAGPFVLWQKADADTGYRPTSGNSVGELLPEIANKDWFITPGPVEIGVVQRRASPKKADKKAAK